MKLAILAGGLGSRLAEETDERPKALVEIGGGPIMWHIVRHYAHHGVTEVLIALGHLGHHIRSYVSENPNGFGPNVTVDLLDTGESTGTGGRVKQLAEAIGDRFLLAYCDGLSDIDVGALAEAHESRGGLTTLTLAHPPPRFGKVRLDGDLVTEFREKPQELDEWVNAGIFVVERDVCDYIDGDDTEWDRTVLPRLASDRRLFAYRHDSFWRCMDTLADKRSLEKIWRGGAAPWKTWE